jgi:O-methyltransferase involved in polyketide biosynthesis
MDDRNVTDLPPVAKTLLAPLGCRARETQRADAILHDRRALEVMQTIEGGFNILSPMGNSDQVFTMMRARRFDMYAREFINLHPDGLVVDIGCGLDTRFYRLDNGRLHWLGIDLPEVIALRRRLLPYGKRNHSQGFSMLDLAWLDEVKRQKKPVIFLAEGVFCYFHEADVKRVIQAIASRFPGARLAFDILSMSSIKLHNRTSRTLKETNARLNWGVDDPHSLESWGLELVDVWGYFDDRESRLGLYHLMRLVPAWRDANRVVLYRAAGNTGK